MPPDSRHIALSKMRLTQARNCLDASVSLLASGFFKDAATRSYYAVFHSMRAVLALDEFDSKKHSGVISEFQRRYIKTRAFDEGFSKIIKSAFMVRGKSDYDDFYIISKDDVAVQIENARSFLTVVETHLDPLLSTENSVIDSELPK
jgi:uncharacterized protein (UPF0332 family)